jgi:hypothetical protein
MIVQKYKRETRYVHAHTKLYLNGIYIGYIVRNDSKFANVNENFNFVSKLGHIESFYKKTKKEIIDFIQEFGLENKDIFY